MIHLCLFLALSLSLSFPRVFAVTDLPSKPHKSSNYFIRLNWPYHVTSMAPLPSSFSTEHRRRRCSKAQMCFFNILHIISVFPTADVTDDKRLRNDKDICENQGFVVDLNIRLSPGRFDRRKSESLVTDDSELAVEEERVTVHSEISHVGDQSSGIHYNGVSENDKPRDEGYLGLLIEAAQLILSDDSEQPPISKIEPERSKYTEASSTSGREAKRKLEWYAEFEDTSPVVKSKRGRNQVLPHKYRDSVVERWTSPASNHRSISHATVGSKRRLK